MICSLVMASVWHLERVLPGEQRCPVDSDGELDGMSCRRADSALHDHHRFTGRDFEQLDFVRSRHPGTEGLRDLVWLKAMECEYRESAASPGRAGGRVDQRSPRHVALPVIARQ